MTIILDNYPPSTLQGVGLGCRRNARIIVGENYCHFGASYLSAFYQKNPSKNLVFTESPYRRLLRTLLRSVLLHDPLGVHPPPCTCVKMYHLGPKVLHYITLLFRIDFPDYVIILYITDLVPN